MLQSIKSLLEKDFRSLKLTGFIDKSMTLAPSQELITQVARFFPDAVFYKQTSDRVIALTIDDVGDPSTELILEAIAHHNATKVKGSQPVRATFFVISGYLKGSPRLVEAMLQQGHEIGNHGVWDRTHANLLLGDFEAEFNQAHEELSQQTGVMLRWFRPGRGFYNPTMLKTVRNKPGYNPSLALASMLPLDTWNLSYDPKFTINYVSQFIFPGAILLLHGGLKQRSANTAIVLREILPILEDRGFRIVTLSELFGSDARTLITLPNSDKLWV